MATTTPRDHTCPQHQILGDDRDLGVADTRSYQAISGEVDSCRAGVRGQVVPRAPITPGEWPELAHSAFQPPAADRAHDEAAVAPAVFAATGALSRPARSVLQINLRLLLRNP